MTAEVLLQQFQIFDTLIDDWLKQKSAFLFYFASKKTEKIVQRQNVRNNFDDCQLLIRVRCRIIIMVLWPFVQWFGEAKRNCNFREWKPIVVEAENCKEIASIWEKRLSNHRNRILCLEKIGIDCLRITRRTDASEGNVRNFMIRICWKLLWLTSNENNVKNELRCWIFKKKMVRRKC